MFMSDASGSGYALLESRVLAEEFWQAANHVERWRFRPVLTTTSGPWTVARAAETPDCILLHGGDDDYRADLPGKESDDDDQSTSDLAATVPTSDDLELDLRQRTRVTPPNTKFWRGKRSSPKLSSRR